MAAGDVSVSVTNAIARGGARFDGSNDKVSSTTARSQISISKPYSLSMWIKVPATASAQSIFDHANTSSDCCNIFLNSNLLRAGMYNGSSYFVQQAVSYTSTVWNHIMITYDGSSTLILYLNGTAVSSVGGNPFTSQSVGFALGSRVSNENYLKGTIGDVRLHEVVLTAAEAVRVAAGELVTRGLVNRWKLYEDYNDSVGTFNLTNSGTSLVAQDSNLANVVKTARTSSADSYYFIPDINNQVMSVVIDEA